MTASYLSMAVKLKSALYLPETFDFLTRCILPWYVVCQSCLLSILSSQPSCPPSSTFVVSWSLWTAGPCTGCQRQDFLQVFASDFFSCTLTSSLLSYSISCSIDEVSLIMICDLNSRFDELLKLRSFCSFVSHPLLDYSYNASNSFFNVSRSKSPGSS